MKPLRKKPEVYILNANVMNILPVLFMLFIVMFILVIAVTSVKQEIDMGATILKESPSEIEGSFFYSLLGSENHYFLSALSEEQQDLDISQLFIKLATNINLDDPRSLLGRELPAFSLFDSEILVAGDGTNYTNLPLESAPPQPFIEAGKEAALQRTDEIKRLEVKEKKQTAAAPTTGDKKIVYLYFSHNRESFLPYLKGVKDPNLAQHSKINITNLGDVMKEELEMKGIGTTVEKKDIQNLLNKKGWSYTQSYQGSREVVTAAMSDNRDLSYFIDIHRDSQRRKNTTTTIDGKDYAKIAFVIGGNNKNFEKNQQLAEELHGILKKKYKSLSRGVILKKGAYTNGKFNQDLSENSILVEIGGVDNTFEELNRTSKALADAFSEYYWKAESVNGN
ncbi:stage II sporulation protein P [Niallia circulans]|uniref:Stage II sporulation protein P n=1 Tax=Niallia circulans TaxID=1397 RepID=A0A553SKJ9_NIACI|nr:stage II sporulation protein P [Niallia circulans]TRZ37523.1 stage II sporulation protein P [Niallia circulans]